MKAIGVSQNDERIVTLELGELLMEGFTISFYVSPASKITGARALENIDRSNQFRVPSLF